VDIAIGLLLMEIVDITNKAEGIRKVLENTDGWTTFMIYSTYVISLFAALGYDHLYTQCN